jgi:hypothetical protein
MDTGFLTSVGFQVLVTHHSYQYVLIADVQQEYYCHGCTLPSRQVHVIKIDEEDSLNGWSIEPRDLGSPTLPRSSTACSTANHCHITSSEPVDGLSMGTSEETIPRNVQHGSGRLIKSTPIYRNCGVHD